MDCSGAGTGENNNIAPSFFFLANLISEGIGKVHSSHFKWSAPHPCHILAGHLSTAHRLVENTLQTLHFLITFFTLALNLGIHQLSLTLAIVFAVPRCLT